MKQLDSTTTVHSPVRPLPSRRRRRALRLGLGLVLGLTAAGICHGGGQGVPAQSSPGPPYLWVADRDGHRVVALSEDLHPTACAELRWPVDVASRADRGAWALSAREGSPLKAHELVRLSAGGAIVASVPLGAVLDLAALDGGDALVLEWAAPAAGGSRVLRVAADGAVSLLGQVAGALTLAGTADRVLVAGEGGRAVLLSAQPGGGVLGRALLDGEIGDVAPGPAGEGWWALDVTGGARLLRLDRDLAPRWIQPVGLHALHLAPHAEEERVWIADTTQPLARRYGPGGALELEVPEVALSGLDRGASEDGGGVLLTAPGAVLRLDALGAPLPAQGGFQFLVDLDRVP